MAASTEQKLDYLLKKIGYTASKTGLAEDSSLSGTKKAPFAEAIPSPLVTPSTTIWNESALIPTTPPGSDTGQVRVYLAGTSGHRMTVDSTVSGSRAFIAYSTYNDTSSGILGDWIDPQFGDAYIIKVYKGDPNSGGVLLSAAGAGSNDTWFFDYSSGVLNFNGTVIPSGVTDTNIYIVGYRYIGVKGLSTAGINTSATSTFKDLSVTGVSTFTGNVSVGSSLLITTDKKLILGASPTTELEIYSDSGGRYLKAKNGGIHNLVDGSFSVKDETDTDYRIEARANGVDLYRTGSKKFSTTGYGVTVFGTTRTQQINVTGVSTFVGDATFSGNVSVGGTLTYEDVTNIDSVGLITARTGIKVLAGGINAVGVVTATSFDGSLATTNLTGTITNAQLAGSITNDKLAGSIANDKLANSTVSYGGISLALGGSDATPAFDLQDATNYPTSSLVGTITNAQLAGSIANDKLANSTVSYGGISLALGGSDATPAFDLTDATNYPFTSLTGITTVIFGDATPKLGGDLNGNSKNIFGVGVLTATSLSGTLLTASQTNITSVGTLSALTVSGTSTLGVTSITNLETQTLNVTGVSTFANNVQLKDNISLKFGDNKQIIATPGDLEVEASGSEDITLTVNASGGTASDIRLKTGSTESIKVNGDGGVIVTGILTATTFSGNLTGNADTATLATNVNVTANNSTNEVVYPIFVDGATGSQGAETDTNLYYNPSSNELHVGAINVNTLTASLNILANGNIVGDNATNISGINSVTATSFFGDGSGLENVGVSTGDISSNRITTGTLNVTGVSTLSSVLVNAGVVTFTNVSSTPSDSLPTGTGGHIYSYDDGIRIVGDNGGIRFHSAGFARWKIDTAGTFAPLSTTGYDIGSTIYPVSNLIVSGNAGIGSLSVTGVSTFNEDVDFIGDNNNIKFDKSASSLKFLDDGNNPGAKAAFGTGNDLQIFHSQGANYIKVVNTQSLVFGTNNTNRAMFESGGHFRPIVDSTYDLGINATRWRNVYADGLYGTLQTAAQPNVTSLGTLTSLNVSGDVSIGGTLTYEDVTNIDSLGIITARQGVRVTSGGLIVSSGVSTFTSNVDINGGTIDGTTIGYSVPAQGMFTNLTATLLTSLNGNVDLGSASTDTISAVGSFDTNLIPSATETKNLGNSSYKWGTLFAKSVNITGVSTFSNASGAINANSTTTNRAINIQLNGVTKGGLTPENDGLELDVNGGDNLTMHLNQNGGNTSDFIVKSNGSELFKIDSGTIESTFTSTDAGSSAGPIINLYRDSSGTDANYLGQIKFQGESDTGVKRNYAKITGKILDASNGTEDGIIEFAHIKAGSQNISARFRSDSLQLLNNTSLTVAGTSDFTGDATFTGNIDVDGHTNLDNVSVAGVTTFSDDVTFVGAAGTDATWVKDRNALSFEKYARIEFGDFLGNDRRFRIFDEGTSKILSANDLTIQSTIADIRLVASLGTMTLSSDNVTLKPLVGGNVLKTSDTTAFLYHSGSEKLKTTSTGVFVTGILTTTDLDVDGHTELDNLRVSGISTFNDHIKLANLKEIQFNSANNAISRNAVTPDGESETTGLIIKTSGSNDLILQTNSAGSGGAKLRVMSGTEQQLVANENGSVDLYFNGSKKLETTNTGVVVTGILTANNVSVASSVTADKFYGNGSGLTGITADGVGAIGGLTIKNQNGSVVGTAGSVSTIDFNGSTGITVTATSGAAGIATVAITGFTTSVGTFNASSGVATIDSFAYATEDYKVAEYTLHFTNGSNIQAQKLLVMQDGSTAYSQEFAVMSSGSQLVSLDAIISGANVLVRATPETGVSGTTTFRWRRIVQE